MNKKILSYKPYLLRPFETLSDEDIIYLTEGYDKYGREGFEDWLKKNKQTRCYASLNLSQLKTKDSEYWKGVHQEYVSRNTAILDIVTQVFKTFHDKGGKSLCVYENFGAVLSSGESIGCFASGDVDLVVNDEEENVAFQSIEECGFKRFTRVDYVGVPKKLIATFYNQEALDGKGYWLNIMRKPVQRNYMLVQSRYKKRLNEECYKNVPYKDTEVMLLDPTALVYYNALHFACEHHYSASPDMALCCDIDRVARSHDIDWKQIVRWAKEDDAGLRLHLAFDICNYFLKTPIPLELFGNESKQYKKLRERIIQDGMMISQDGKLARLYVELASDDMPIGWSLISRLWRR